MKNENLENLSLKFGHCNSCNEDKSVVRVSGLETARDITRLCTLCLVKILSPIPAGFKFRFCKRCKALLCYEPEDTRKKCLECINHLNYLKARRHNFATGAKAFIRKMKKIVKEADKNDIN